MPDWRILLVAVAAIFLLAPPAAVPPEPETFAALVRTVLPSVVNISVKGKGQGANTGEVAENVSYAPHIVDIVGSGSIVDPTGIIVTNRHVIENAYEIMVTLQDGTTTNARLLGKGLSFDLAILKIDVGRPLPAIKVGNSDEVHVGDRVLAIGNPLGLQGTVTNGIVSALHRDLSGPYDEFIQTDAPINHGNSGGPLLDLSGAVIGVNAQIESGGGGSDGVGFALPIDSVKSVANTLVAGGTVQHAYLGIHVGDAPNGAGALIGSVTASSPASRAGLKAGDVITGVDSTRITKADDLTAAITAHAPNDKVTVTVTRNGTTKQIDVTLGVRPS
jgi:serine protease Do